MRKKWGLKPCLLHPPATGICLHQKASSTSALQHQSSFAAAAGAMPLSSTGCGQKVGKAAQHRWHGEVRQKSGFFTTATSSALILELEQLLSSSVPRQN